MSRIVKAANVVYEPAPPQPAPAPLSPPEASFPEASPVDASPVDAHPAGPSAAVERPSHKGGRGGVGQLLDAARAMGTAKREAGRLLRAAHRESERVLEAARREAEQLRGDAREAGMADAGRAADEQVREECRELLAAVHRARDEAMAWRDRLATELHPEWVRLALAIAERLACKEIEGGAETALRIGEEILKNSSSGARLKLRLNPADYRELEQREALHHLRQAGAAAGEVELLPDEAVNRGGCLLETENGVVDGRLGEHLAAIERGLMEQAGEVEDADGDGSRSA